MMTAESMLLKRPVLRIIVALFFLLKLFSSDIYCMAMLSSRLRSLICRSLQIAAEMASYWLYIQSECQALELNLGFLF